MKIFLTSFLLVVFYTISLSQCDYTLKGKVIDHHDRKPLEFAEVFIKELSRGTLSDSTGNYFIDGLCKGTYTLSVKHLGCEDIINTIVVDGNVVQNFYPEHHLHELGLISIVTEREVDKSTSAIYEMKGKELEQKSGMALGDVLKSISGVSVIQTGASISKPVIHGLFGSRVLILNNGVRQEGQQWGNEHAPEIDPFIANKITVIKGAGAVRYGSDAIAGVILVEPNKLRDSAGIGGEYNAVGFSNGRGGASSFMIEQNFKKIQPLSWRLQGTIKKVGNIKTPNYYLKNTGMEEYNFSSALGWTKSNYGVELFYSQFNTSIGIFSGAHIGNVTDLQNAINSSQPYLKSDFSYQIERPKQYIEHELFKTKLYLLTGEKGKLNIMYARQYNLRNEFDAHKPKNDSLALLNNPELNFEITTQNVDVNWEHNSIKNFTGIFGVTSMKQGNTYQGRYFIPNFKNFATGIYMIEKYTKNKFKLEFGLRYEYRYLQVYKYENNSIISPKHKYDNTSSTIAAIYKINKKTEALLNFSSAWRAPNVNELYTKGVHHGAASYEIGDKNLTPEKSYSINANLNHRNNSKVDAQIDIYYNFMKDFIYLKPKLPATVTIAGAFPTFVFSQTDAVLTGLDAQFGYLISNQLKYLGKLSLLRAYDISTNNFLIQMPADRFASELTYTLKDKKKLSNTFFTLGGMFENKQWRVPANSDYMLPPKAYFLFNIEVGTTIEFNTQKIIVGIGAANLFDTVYRNYMNRFRYYSDEMGRNITLRIKIPFNKSNN